MHRGYAVRWFCGGRPTINIDHHENDTEYIIYHWQISGHKLSNAAGRADWPTQIHIFHIVLLLEIIVIYSYNCLWNGL